jgi:hypothetical protein
MIIKKTPGVASKKNIARIFKTINIGEFKSPEDYFSVYDFYKTFGYACLYAALNKTVMIDLTITMTEGRKKRRSRANRKMGGKETYQLLSVPSRYLEFCPEIAYT